MRDLIGKLEKLDGPNNEIDILVEIALFEPDDEFVSVRPNSAGSSRTFWAADHTLTPERREQRIALLRAKEEQDG